MIEWLRDKFRMAVSIFFILTVFISTLGCGVAGFLIGQVLSRYDNYSTIGCVLGLVIGFFLGIVSGVLAYGFLATILHLTETCDNILEKMKLLQRKTVLETSSLVSSEDKGEKKVADGIDLYK